MNLKIHRRAELHEQAMAQQAELLQQTAETGTLRQQRRLRFPQNMVMMYVTMPQFLEWNKPLNYCQNGMNPILTHSFAALKG